MQITKLQPGLKVQFRLGDIHLPHVTEVLNRMTEDMELQGTITLLSDAGDQQAAFAVVEVKGVLMPIILPTSTIKVVEAGDVTAFSADELAGNVAAASHAAKDQD